VTTDEFRACLVALNWSQRGLADLLDRDERMVRRWAAGQYDIPEDVGGWLATLAAFHAKHQSPLKSNPQ
jgi:hypothetical protein